jgi:hypothetical protein
MPDPSLCGYPDVESVGVAPGVSLTPVSGVVRLDQSGQVYENKLVTGSIVVSAADVKIRNVRLVNTDPYYAVSVKSGDNWDRRDANLVLDHVEIDLGGKLNVKGIAFNGYTLRNVFMHNGSDCAHFAWNVTIRDSLCVNGPDANSDGWPDSTAFCDGTDHFDGFQFSGGGNITLDHNTLRNPCSQTSNMLITNDPGYRRPIRRMRVTNNLMAGGGYSVYCADATDSVTDEVVTGNRFARTYYSRGGRWGPTAYCEKATKFSGNIWDGSGRRIPGGRHSRRG